MASQALIDWSITEAKVTEALERILKASTPLRIVAFGSRARGDFGPESDLDLAVIFDHIAPGTKRPVSSAILSGIPASIDLLVTDIERHNRFRPWINSVHYDIENEGIVLYDREHDKRPDRSAIKKIVAG